MILDFSRCFLPRDAMQARSMLSRSVCLSVCLSVCPSVRPSAFLVPALSTESLNGFSKASETNVLTSINVSRIADDRPFLNQ